MADNKGGVIRYGGYGKDPNEDHVLFDSRAPFVGKRSKEDTEGLSVTAKALNQIRNDSSVLKESMGIWQSFKSANTFATQGQRSIESLASLRDGDDVLVYDLETLGTTAKMRKGKGNLDFFHLTEIALVHTKFKNGQLRSSGDHLSMLLAPTEDVYERMHNMIKDVSAGKWKGMSDDVRRTLSDLMLYSGDPKELFTETYINGKRRVGVLKSQNRSVHPMKGSVITSSDNIAMMKQGLENLMEYGTKVEDIPHALNGFIGKYHNVKFAGYNVYNFDQNTMMEYLTGRLGKDAKGKNGSKTQVALRRLQQTFGESTHIDALHTLRSTVRNPNSRFGNSLTLEQLRISGGLNSDKAPDIAHFGYHDAKTTVSAINLALKDADISQAVMQARSGGVGGGGNIALFNTNPLKVGDFLYGYSGLKAGKHDGVFETKGGKLQSAYDMVTNPIYRNTAYKIEKFYNGIEIDGVKKYGVQLENLSDDNGLRHVIMRDSLGELQDAIHNSLQHIQDPSSIDHLHGLQNQDRAARRWKKMFSNESGGGWALADRMYQALDAVNDPVKGLSPGASDEEVKKFVVGLNKWNTDAFARDFVTMRGRLQAEEKWLKPFVNRLGKSQMAYATRNNAMINYGKYLDETGGVNEGDRDLTDRALQISRTDGKQAIINLSNPSAIKGNIYGIIKANSTDMPAPRILRERYKQLIGQLKAIDPILASKYDKWDKNLEGIGSKDSFDAFVTEMANDLYRAKLQKKDLGINQITVEDITGLNDTRGTKLGDALKSGTINDLEDRAIANTYAFGTNWKGSSGKDLAPQHTVVGEMIDKFDNAILSVLKDSGVNIDPNDITKSNGIRMGVGLATDTRSALTQLAGAFVNNGMNVQYRYDSKRKGLYMVLADKELSEAVLDGSIGDLRDNNRVSIIDLPAWNDNGTITLGTQNRVARLGGKKTGKNSYEFTTAFSEVLESIQNNAGVAARMMKNSKAKDMNNGALEVERYLNSVGKKAIQSLSMNNRKMNTDTSHEMFGTTSRLSNWSRGGHFDASVFAEEWYENYYATANTQTRKTFRLSDPEQIRRKARENKDIFMNQMGSQARRVFLRDLPDWAKQNMGIELDYHSVKDTHATQGVLATRDTRRLTPFGGHNQMARENIMKSVNYFALDRNTVLDKLSGMGAGKVDRLLNRGIVTDRALKVMGDPLDGGELGYLNVRTAHMGDKTITKRIAEAKRALSSQFKGPELDAYLAELSNVEKLSTYDGMFLLADDVAKAFEVEREKNIRLSPGAKLDSKIVNMINKYTKTYAGVEFDPTQSMNFDEMGLKDNRQILLGQSTFGTSKKNGKITVGSLINDSTKGTDFYDGWNNDIRIKGWDAENQTLILGEQVKSMNSSKAISDTGQRITYTKLSRSVLEALAGGHADAITPGVEATKKMWGTFAYGSVNLAVDEMKKQVDEGKLTIANFKDDYTVSEMSKENVINEGLQYIRSTMISKLGIEDKDVKIRGQQIVMSEFFGFDGEATLSLDKVGSFTKDIDEKFGTRFYDGKTLFTQMGLGKQNVYDWENGVGLIDSSRAGLVKYGYKELDMIKARANAVPGVGTAVTGWLEGHMRDSAAAQQTNLKGISNNLYKTAFRIGNESPMAGDVVIRTTGQSFDGTTMVDNKEVSAGRIKNGVYEMSMHDISNLPFATDRGQTYTAGDYAKSIIDFGRADVGFDGVGLKKVLENNGGTALLEMPDESFSRKYIRMVDFGDIQNRGIVDTPMIRDIEKKQLRLWRDIKEYQSLGSSGEGDPTELEASRDQVKQRIEEGLTEYDKAVVHLQSSAREGSFAKTFGSAKLGMAGRFRIQGINPFANYEKSGNTWEQTGKYKEGTMYVSRERMTEMIMGESGPGKDRYVGFKNIAETMNIDIKGLKDNALVKKVLDHASSEGLYGFVNRYPTINQSTIQALRIEIDDELGKNDRAGFLTVGTAARLKADFDGDFMSAALAHYGIRDKDQRAAVHGEMKKLWESEKEENVKEGIKQMESLDKALNMEFTVGQLSKMQNKEVEKWFNETWSTRTTQLDAFESMQARLGKEFIGFADNTRYKITNLAQTTYNVLEKEGLMTAKTIATKRQVIEDFGKVFSQELISSKKFDTTDIMQGFLDGGFSKEDATEKTLQSVKDRYLLVEAMNAAVLDPTEDNINLFRAANDRMGLFTGPEGITKMNNALKEIQEVAAYNSSAGGFRNKSLQVGISEGFGSPTAYGKLISGQSEHLIPTQVIADQINNLNNGSVEKQVGLDAIGRYENSVIANYKRHHGQQKTILDSLTSGSKMVDHEPLIGGATLAEEAGVRFRDVMGTLGGGMGMSGSGMAGAGWGAAMFGGLWAASALMRSGPTPEGLQENAPPPPPIEALSTPTARVTENGEFINIRVSAQDAQGMGQNDVAALVHQELSAMTNASLNMNMNVNDNTQNIDQQWLQGVVANAIGKGFGY